MYHIIRRHGDSFIETHGPKLMRSKSSSTVKGAQRLSKA
jgi:hypothetical protein